jgi:ribosomal protein RSM22 (predicted rRNA methylase)
MILFPKKLENRIFRHLKESFYLGTKRAAWAGRPFDQRDLQFFAKGAAELSELFTSERVRLRGDYLQRPELRAGYLLYFLPINFTKASWVLRQIPSTFWQRPSLRVLDLGSGPATASLAFLNELRGQNPKAEIKIHLVDQNKTILKDGERLLLDWHEELHFEKSGPGSIKARTFNQALARVRLSKKYDLIILHHVLNEFTRLGAQQRAEWLLPLLNHHLKPDGLVIIIEPALKRPGRELMALRDHLLAEAPYRILAPCLHENICPMLAGTKSDWCHFYVNWQEPDFMKQLDHLLGNDNRHLKLSYLLLGWSEAWREIFPDRDRWFRVVSNRMATRGKTEMILCGRPGRIRVTRLDRHRSPNNQDLDKTKRGDLVQIPEFRAKEYTVEGSYRVGTEDRLGVPEIGPKE